MMVASLRRCSPCASTWPRVHNGGRRSRRDLARTHALRHCYTEAHRHQRYMRTTHIKRADTGRKTPGKSQPRRTDRELEDMVPHLRGAEVEDAEWRRAHPHAQLRSAYLTIVGENPDARAGDHRTAEAVLSRIKRAQEHGGWTRSEWNRLRKMEIKWRMRLLGKDFRFELVGNKRGGLPAPLQRLLRLRKQMGEIRRALDAEKSEA